MLSNLQFSIFNFPFLSALQTNQHPAKTNGILSHCPIFNIIPASKGSWSFFTNSMKKRDPNTGRHELVFYMAPMVHWPEVMVTYDVTDKIVFSADAFGTYGTLDGGVIDTEMNVEHYWEEMIRYYSNIVGKYGSPVQRALQKLSGLDIQTICSTHGPVWREYASKAIDIYDRMSRYEGEEGVVIIYGSMYGNTEQMAEAIAASLADNGIKNIVMHNVSKSPSSYILKDVFKYKGVIVGSPTYSNQLFPEVEAVLSKIELREVKNRIFGYFGSFTWAGAAVKRLAAFGEKMKWETVGTPVEQKQGLSATKYEECLTLGKEMAGKLKIKGFPIYASRLSFVYKLDLLLIAFVLSVVGAFRLFNSQFSIFNCSQRWKLC